jgi:cell division protein FtsL
MATMALSNVRRAYGVTPELYFQKYIDNSHLVRVADPKRRREMMMVTGALALLLAVILVFCWQHYRSIEYGYRNEALRQQTEELLEARRHLQLEEEELRAPGRIEEIARQMGLQSPLAGQVIGVDNTGVDAGGPVLARNAAVSVVSVTQ